MDKAMQILGYVVTSLAILFVGFYLLNVVLGATVAGPHYGERYGVEERRLVCRTFALEYFDTVVIVWDEPPENCEGAQ